MKQLPLTGKKTIELSIWLIIFSAIAVLCYKHPLTRPQLVGDEGYYMNEVAYFIKYGAYNALSQGTSFLYTLLVYSFAGICHIEHILSARILAILFFILCCILILKGSKQLKNAPEYTAHVAVSFFIAISINWLSRGLPDFIAMAVALIAFLILAHKTTYVRIFISGILLFAAFAIKPVFLFAVPCFAAFVFFKELHRSAILRNLVKACILPVGFVLLFVAYHMPGYRVYHKLMLEDKDHAYTTTGARTTATTTWGELNTYYELYNTNQRENKWAVTWDEVNEFKQQHPEVNLKLGPSDYMVHHSAHWARHVATSFFFMLPYFIQGGFFFSKWTVVNSLLHIMVIIHIITLLLIGAMFYVERRFIQSNYLYIGMGVLFFLQIGALVMSQLENNWLFFCLPFAALPAIVFLTRRLNIYLLLSLQFIYILLMI